jgi:hypothetical protein
MLSSFIFRLGTELLSREGSDFWRVQATFSNKTKNLSSVMLLLWCNHAADFNKDSQLHMIGGYFLKLLSG